MFSAQVVFAVSCVVLLFSLLAHLDQKFTEQFSLLGDRFTSLEDRFTSLEGRFSSLEGRFSSLEDEVKSNRRSVSNSSEFAASIQIKPKSGLGNDLACGTVVQFFGESFLLTAKHVVFQDEDRGKACFRDIVSILWKGVQTDFGNDFLVHRKFDLALIPLVGLRGVGAHISDREIEIHDQLFGTAVREKGVAHALRGYVRERDSAQGGFLADLQGTHGFSGAGYFQQGAVVAVHHGQGQFSHLGESRDNLEFSGAISAKNEFLKYCNTGGKFNESQCWNSFETLLALHARNPLASVISASSIFEGMHKRDPSIETCDS